MNDSETGTDHHNYETEVVLPAAILSLLLGILGVLSNGFLLLTLFQDPLKCFKARSPVVFVFFLALSDFLGSFIVQLPHSICMFCRIAQIELNTLYNVAVIGSHLGTKISVFTVVGMSFDRYLAVKLIWRYRSLVKFQRVIFLNVCLWIFVGSFEASHSMDKELMHQIDLHLQTTVPLTLLTLTNLATYLEFRRYSRNSVLAQGTSSNDSCLTRRNIEIVKNIVKVVLMIMAVLFVSLIPYLVTKNLNGEHCHGKEHCNESTDFAAAKNIAISLLGVSSVVNPFLYAFRISNYRRAFKLVFIQVCGGTQTPDLP